MDPSLALKLIDEYGLTCLALVLQFAPLPICLVLFGIANCKVDGNGHSFASDLGRSTTAAVEQIKAQPLLALSCFAIWMLCKGLFNFCSLLPDCEIILLVLSIAAFMGYILVSTVFNVALVQRLAREDNINLLTLSSTVTTVSRLICLTVLLSFTGVFGALLILPTVWFFLRLSLAPNILILQETGIKVALSTSWQLTRGHFWTVAYLILPVLILQFIPDFVFDGARLMYLDDKLPAWFDGAVSWTDVGLAPFECVLDFLYFGLSYQLYRRLSGVGAPL